MIWGFGGLIIFLIFGYLWVYAFGCLIFSCFVVLKLCGWGFVISWFVRFVVLCFVVLGFELLWSWDFENFVLMFCFAICIFIFVLLCLKFQGLSLKIYTRSTVSGSETMTFSVNTIFCGENEKIFKKKFWASDFSEIFLVFKSLLTKF